MFEGVSKRLIFVGSAISVFVAGLFYNDILSVSFPWYQGIKYLVVFLSVVVPFVFLFGKFNPSLYEKDKVYLFQKFVLILLYVLTGMLFLSFFPLLTNVFKLLYLVVFSFGLYLLLLAVNVFIVSESRGSVIPLIQPSRMVTSLAVLSTVFWGSTVIYKVHLFSSPLLSVLVNGVAFFVFFYIVFFSSAWFIVNGYHKIGQFTVDFERVKWILTASFVVLGEVSFVLSFVPLESYGRAVILTGYAYAVLIFAQLYVRHLLVRSDIVKFITVIGLVYLLSYFM